MRRYGRSSRVAWEQDRHLCGLRRGEVVCFQGKDLYPADAVVTARESICAPADFAIVELGFHLIDSAKSIPERPVTRM